MWIIVHAGVKVKHVSKRDPRSVEQAQGKWKCMCILYNSSTLERKRIWWFIPQCSVQCTDHMVSGMEISLIKIRRSWEHFILIREIPVLVRRCLCIENTTRKARTLPCFQHCHFIVFHVSMSWPCWGWPGDVKSKGISSHDIDLAHLKYSGLAQRYVCV